MTRKIVYGAGLVAFASATAMTLAAIVMPNWISYGVTSRSGQEVNWKLGLHQSCSSVADPRCRPFPSRREDCSAGDGDDGAGSSFCSIWRTTGFLMSFAAVAELATLVGFVVVMSGGKQRRVQGWRVLSSLLGIVAVVLLCAMALVSYVYDNEDMFTVPGWHLDKSWVLTTVSAGIAALSGVGLAASAYLLPQERGYEFLSDSTGA